MLKSWQVLYQCGASIQTSKVLLSLGFFNKPNIFATAKYFFLWPFQVYYRRQGEYFHVFPLNSAGSHLSLPKDPAVTFLRENSSPVGDCQPSALPAPGTSTYQPATPGHHPEPAMVPMGIGGGPQWISISGQESKAVPRRYKSRGVCQGFCSTETLWEGAATWGGCSHGSGDPHATSCSGQHKTWPQPPFPHPHWGCNGSQSSLTLLFIFVPFLGIGFQMFENSSLSTSFPSGLSSQCLIMFNFQTRSPFPFQSLF